MRGATYYYLAQAQRPHERRQTQPGARPDAGNRGRHAHPHAPRRGRPVRELPAAARRVIAALSGASSTA
jgi:hypothetical protein